MKKPEDFKKGIIVRRKISAKRCEIGKTTYIGVVGLQKVFHDILNTERRANWIQINKNSTNLYTAMLWGRLRS